MGQKISVNLFRAKQRLSNVHAKSGDVSGLQKSVWFASGRSYSKLLMQDLDIRTFLKAKLPSAGVVEVIIKRYVRKVQIDLYVTRPGVVIGKGGASINALKDELIKKFALPRDLKINIEEFKDPSRSAQVVANDIAQALQKGLPYRRIIKSSLERIRYSGIQGASIQVKGRLNGAEIARKEKVTYGSIPRHTLDSVLDYALVHCRTTAGVIGIQVLLFKGDKISNYNNK